VLEVFIGGAAGPGKDLTLDTPIPTINGWSTIRDLKINDWIIGGNGLPCQVISKSPVYFNKRIFRVYFDNKTYIDASETHDWLTFSLAERSALARRNNAFRERRRNTRPLRSKGLRPELSKRNSERVHKYLEPPSGSIRSTLELFNSFKVQSRTNYSIPVTSAWELDTVDLPIHPYLLGVWLGDGTTNSGFITSADIEIPSLIQNCGYNVYKLKEKYAYRVEGLTTLLRVHGLKNNKHIPNIYLRASYEQRLELLKGLMDTDGGCDKDGDCEITLTNKVLALQALELIRTLGFKGTYTTGRATLYGKDCGEKYRVRVTTSTPIFKLQRKLNRQITTERKTQQWHYIKDIQEIESVPTQCISVNSENHTFVAGDGLIQTHNSVALLMAALQYVDHSDYAAILFRRTYPELALPGALMGKAQEWLYGTDAKWNDTKKTWTFPSGATLTFGHLENYRSHFNYQSTEFQFIGFDELTTFPQYQYDFLFSRLRKTINNPVPLRVRCASNPGGIGEAWVKAKFVDSPNTKESIFIPAKLNDNPSLNKEEYIKSLMHLDPVTREKLLNGDWTSIRMGGKFRRSWFRIIEPEDIPKDLRQIRYWDLASSPKDESDPQSDPDWLVGCKGGYFNGSYYVTHVRRMRGTPNQVEQTIKNTAQGDGKNVSVFIEREPGSAGELYINHLKSVLKGWPVHAHRLTGDKEHYIDPISSQAEAGNITLVNGPWLDEFLYELELFPTKGVHDDQVDAFAKMCDRATRRGLQII